MNYNNILTGYKINSQLPLDAKSNVASEAIIKSLGTSSKLAYTYEKGLIIYCQLEGTRYEWREAKLVEDTPGILTTGNFTYPTNWVVAGVDYSNKVYNFFNIKQVAQVQSDWNSSSGVSAILNKPQIINPPFASINNGFFVRNRDETQFGTLGAYSYDFSKATIGTDGDVYGQVGQNGVEPTELYGALGPLCFVKGYNVSAQGYGDTVLGVYNHSDVQSQFSTIFGRNNYNNSYHTIMGGGYNRAPYTYLGHKTIFGNGNVVNGTAGLTSGVALINKSFSTTVLGQANSDYTNTEQTKNVATAPILIVGNGDVNVPVGLWSATSRSDAFILLKNGLATLPSVTNDLITAASGKAIVTKEYLTSVLPATVDGSETKINSGTNVSITGTGTLGSPYVVNSSFTNTTYTAGTGLTLTGTVFSTDNLQKVITADYTLTSADNNYEIIVDNGTTAVSITVPNGLTSKIGIGFTQKGTGDISYIASGTTINTPIGLKIKGQFYQTYLSQEGSTNVFYLGGNTKI